MPQDRFQDADAELPDFVNIELADVIDAPALQEMMDDYYALTGIGVGIIDLKGRVLVGTGWQDICVRFHRTTPESCTFCHESDTSLSSGISPGTFKEYRCKNNMWDIATPIMLGDRHIGNIFLGQYFYDDEQPDYELFRAQARRFGYDEAEYLAALDRVPRWSRETVQAAMQFYAKLAGMISKANYNNVILADTLAKREQAEAALRWMRISVENSSDALYWITPDARIAEVNEAACRSLGYTREELLQLTVPDIDPNFNPITWPRQFATLRQHGSMTFESEQRTKSGRMFPVEVVANHVKFGSEERHCAFVRDITERKQMEQSLRESEESYRRKAAELEAVNRELETFNYTVSHDLRAPLTSISMCNQIIQARCSSSSDEELRNVVTLLDEQIKRMNQIISTLLDFSRLTSCKMSRDKVDLSVLARVVAAQLRMNFPQRLVSFVIADGEEVWGDEGLLRTVLENLIGNAWKYSSNLESALIEFGVAEPEGGSKVYFVRDNGCGFDMKYADKLLIPFQRLPGAEGCEGFGIGLATVDRIIRRHGGKIWAEGVPGKGAVFYFTLGESDGHTP